MKHLSKFVATLLCLCTLAWSSAAWSAYPEKPIWWIVPYAVGGSSDVVSRILGKRLGERLHQQILVDSKPGASATIGEEFVARAAPDGYTVLYDAFALAVNPALRKLRFDPAVDLVPITQIANMYVIFVAPANAPYNTLAEFLDYARKNPNKVSYGNAGSGTASHLAGELLKSRTKTEGVDVAYKGGGPATVAAMAGDVSVYFATAGSGMPSIKAGKLKPLAVAAPKRLAALPDVPTFAELGYADVVASEWNGLFAPKGTPPEIIKLLNKEVGEVLAEPGIREQLAKFGIEPVTSTPEEFTQFVGNEIKRWGAIVKQLNLRAD